MAKAKKAPAAPRPPKIEAGQIVVLIEPRTFSQLTDEGIQKVTINPGTAVQVLKVEDNGIGLEIRKGRFMTFIQQKRVRPATAEEREDFLIESGDQRKEKKARNATQEAHSAAQISRPVPEAMGLDQITLFYGKIR